MTRQQKILIVDDREDNLFTLRQILSGVDAEIIEANTGNEALAASLDHDFALAILDVMMPEMSGYELANHLRGDKKTQLIPIVFLSASHLDEQSQFKGYESGAIDYIVKPYAPEVLLSKVNIFLELDRSKRELQRHRDHLELLVAARTTELIQRVKETKCLYALSSLVVEQRISVEETLSAAVDLIPPGWQYPEITRARLLFEDKAYAPADFVDTPWKQSADIMLSGEAVGTVEVCYLEEKPPLDEGPFLRQERDLLNDIGRQLGVMIARKQAENTLMIRRRIAEAFLKYPDDGVYEEVLRIVLEVMDSESGALGYLDEEGSLVFPVMTRYGPDRAETLGKDIVFPRETWGDSSWPRAIREKTTIFSNTPSINIPEGHVAISRHISLPLMQRGEARGLIQVANKATDYTKTDVVRLETIGEVLAPLLSVRTQRDKLERQHRIGEEWEQLRLAALELLNRSPDCSEAIREILTLLREHTGLEAVGIRLRDGDDFPYYETQGFPEEFIQTECSLYQRDEASELLRDPEGNPVLACMCGSILRGRTDPSLPVFTEGGSFWTNSISELLASTSEEELATRAPVRCQAEGYESLALIPLRAGAEITGLLQFNDPRPGQLTPDLIRFFESLASSIGMALARRESEEAYRTLFEGMAEGVLVVERQTTHIRLANPAICKLFGYTEQELTRLGVADICPKESLAQAFLELGGGALGETSHAESIPLLHKDGVIIYADLSLASIEFGGHEGLVVFIRDITETRKLEEQFRQAQKLEAVGQLAGGIAHDFNNLLTIILGYGNSILDGLHREDPLREGVSEIVKAGQRAAVLTRQLLAFSRKQTLQPKVLDLNAVVGNLQIMLRRVIGEDIEFTTVLDEELGRTKADPGQLEQVIMNLTVNARDAMPEGGTLIIKTANIELDQECAEERVGVVPGRYVMLAVTDTGSGMDEETRSRLFEPFFTTKEQGKGTGLGLSTVYGIVKQTGGNIWVYSEPGKGTTFKIYLPRTDDEPTTEVTRVEEQRLQGKGESVLVVEDELMVRNLLKAMVARLGYQVTVASNGGEALLAVEEAGLRPDLVITDVVMPGMSGPVLVERLRKSLPEAKVLYISGYADNAIIHHGVLDSDINLMQKPFSVGDLAMNLQKLLQPKAKPQEEA